jgi:hypothetical protein
MTRNELIELGERILASQCNDAELNDLLETFDKNVPRPKGSNLFYWPENYSDRTTIISEYNPTVEEVVDRCLAYKPIIL